MKCIRILIVFAIIFQSGLLSAPVFSQDEDTARITSDALSSENSVTEQSGETARDTGKRGFSISTMWELVKLAEGIGYLLILVLAMGILFIFQKWFVLMREQKDSEKIPVNKMKTMSYDDIEKMFTRVKAGNIDAEDEEESDAKAIPLLKKIFRQKKASAFQLLQKLYKIFDAQKTTTSFNDETSNYIQYMKDVFNPFVTRLSFLSDTSGALGLLGTVWGMFLVFYKASPDPEDTLQGMGIALATTIIGLVISIILNSFTTVVSNLFDKNLDFVNKMATVFQERLMREEERYPVRAQPILVDSSSMPIRSQVMPEATIRDTKIQEKPRIETSEAPITPQIVHGPPSELRVIKGDNQSGEVNCPLSEPIIVEVLDGQGNPLENETVIFTAEDAAGVFSNNNRVQKILTDDEGRAQTKFTLGKTSGEKTIHIAIEGSNARGAKLLAIAKPTPPTKLVELKGNFQTGELGKRLPIPFVIAIQDRYDNPIPMFEVDFTLKKGSGRFQDSKNAHYTAHTNEDGLAEVYFIVGNNRGAREIEVEAKKVDPSKITFEVFAV